MSSNSRDDEVRFDISRKLVEGMNDIHVFGRNNISSNDIQDVWCVGGEYIWATVASTLTVVSTDANDTAAGTGVRAVRVQGLDANFLEIAEDIPTNGLAGAVSSLSFIRVNGIRALNQGTYQTSTTTGGPGGDILVTRTVGGAAEGIILATDGGVAWDYGRAELGRFTIPAGRNGYITRIVVSSEAAQASDFILWGRGDADVGLAPFGSKIVLLEFDGIDAPYNQEHNPPVPVPPKTDLWWSVKKGIANSSAISSLEIILDTVTI